MADLIDRDSLRDYLRSVWGCGNTDNTVIWYGDVLAAINDFPSVDAVPVVRCKDCIFKREKREFGDLKCIILGMPMRFDNFCSYGEKNDNTNTEV